MLETVKTSISDAKDDPTTFQQAFVNNLMNVQDEMLEQEMKSLDKLNADLTISKVGNLIAQVSEELNNI